METICCDPSFEPSQIRVHNIGFYAELTRIIPNYYQILPLIKSSDEDVHHSVTINQEKKSFL